MLLVLPNFPIDRQGIRSRHLGTNLVLVLISALPEVDGELCSGKCWLLVSLTAKHVMNLSPRENKNCNIEMQGDSRGV